MKINRVGIGVFFFGACIGFFKWWGILSLIIILPFIGWKDRRKGPFKTNRTGYVDFKLVDELKKKAWLSFAHMENLVLGTVENPNNIIKIMTGISVVTHFLRKEGYGYDYKSDQELFKDFLFEYSNAIPIYEKEYTLINDVFINYDLLSKIP